MSNSFYVTEASRINDQFVVTGYPGGIIPLGMSFTRAETIDYVDGEKVIKADPQPPPQAIMVRVVKILSYDQELPELSELMGGHLVLEGKGVDLIQRGMQLFE